MQTVIQVDGDVTSYLSKKFFDYDSEKRDFLSGLQEVDHVTLKTATAKRTNEEGSQSTRTEHPNVSPTTMPPNMSPEMISWMRVEMDRMRQEMLSLIMFLQDGNYENQKFAKERLLEIADKIDEYIKSQE